MTSEITPTDIFTVNPYEGHPSLSELEAEVLWEYAKLAQHIRSVRRIAFLGSTYCCSSQACPALPQDAVFER